MKNISKTMALISALAITATSAACSSNSDERSGHGYLLDEAQTTPSMTVPINTETLAPEQEQQVADLADSLTGELENKTIKWMSFYDPWHPTGQGNSKPVSVELFEKRYGGEIEYYPTTWANFWNDLSTNVLGGVGIDFFPDRVVPKCVVNGMTQSYDKYVDWDSSLWSSVRSINDDFIVGENHYLMVCQVTEGYVVYYNRKTIEENGYDDPKELYENGKWTMEKFKNMLTDFVDEEEGRYGLDGWFNCSPLYLASGVPPISLENGVLKNNLSDPSFERAMLFQQELNKKGLVLDKSLFNWTTQIHLIGEQNELFYIGGIYEIEQAPEIWTKTFGDANDVFFVPIPRDEQADKYYYNAEFDCYNLCVGADNPEGTARFMECIIASYSDKNAQVIDDQKHMADFGWTEEMIEMRNEVLRLTQENPVGDILGGLTDDVANTIGDAVSKPLSGEDWYQTRESIYDNVSMQINEINSYFSS